jgi:hypothetical protein
MDAWVGAVGGLVGVVIGWGLAFWQERERWRREDQTRFHNLSRGLYARFLDIADKALAAAAEHDLISQSHGKYTGDVAERLEKRRQEQLSAISRHRDDLRQVYREISIVAPDDVVASAAAAIDLLGAFSDPGDVLNEILGADIRRPTLADLARARDAFMGRARHAFGLAAAA